MKVVTNGSVTPRVTGNRVVFLGADAAASRVGAQGGVELAVLLAQQRLLRGRELELAREQVVDALLAREHGHGQALGPARVFRP